MKRKLVAVLIIEGEEEDMELMARGCVLSVSSREDFVLKSAVDISMHGDFGVQFSASVAQAMAAAARAKGIIEH